MRERERERERERVNQQYRCLSAQEIISHANHMYFIHDRMFQILCFLLVVIYYNFHSIRKLKALLRSNIVF